MGNESKDNFGEMKNTGINFLTPYIFGGKTALKKGYFAIALPLGNAKKVEEFIRKIDKTTIIKTEKNVKYMELGSGNVLGWDTKNLLFLTSVKLKNNSSLKEELFRLHNLSNQNMLAYANKKFQRISEKKSRIWACGSTLGS